MRPDLMALLGHRVTVTGPAPTDTFAYTGKLVALADHPTLILDLDDGQRMVLKQQTCTVTPAREPAPEHSAPWADIFDTRRRENTLTSRLEAMLANLNAHIEQRAAGLAQPLIDQAREDAAVEVSGARGMQQRAEDLNTELRRQLRPLQRQVDEYHPRAKKAEAAVERMRTLIDSYPPGSDFVTSGAAAIFRDTLNDTLGQDGGTYRG